MVTLEFLSERRMGGFPCLGQEDTGDGDRGQK